MQHALSGYDPDPRPPLTGKRVAEVFDTVQAVADLVDIFEPADESEVATVEEQESFFRAWVDSVRQRLQVAPG